jgi:hypothetical protein
LRLITPLIYTSINSQEKDLTLPLAKLWGIFLNALSNRDFNLALNNGLKILSYLSQVV